MDNDLLDLIDEVMPELNPKIAEGFAYHDSVNFEPHVVKILREASNTLERLGIKFGKCTHVTPKERLWEITRPRKSRRSYELGRNNFYMIKVEVSLHGKPLRTRYLYIPFLTQDGTLFIKDVKYLISPTFEDTLFSVEDGAVFLPVSRARNTFKRTGYYYLANDVKESVDTYWSKLHHSRVNEAPKNRLPQLFNYMLAEHGITESFKRYFHTDVVYGTAGDVNEDNYPPEHWVICKSLGFAPRSVIGSYRTPSLVLAIPKDQYENLGLKSAIASVMYIADICSSQMFFDIGEMDEPFLWKRVLSRFIWSSIDDRDAITQVDEHLISVNDYIDEIARKKLRRNNIEVDSILELFQYVIWQFSTLTINNDVASLKDKRLVVTSKIMYPIVSMIFNIVFKLTRMKPARIKPENVDQFLDKHWFPQFGMSITKANGWISVFESTTDQKLYKISTTVNVDSKVKSQTKSDEMLDPSFVLHPDMIGIISFTFISKSSPSSRGHLNPWMKLDDDNRPILQKEDDCYREEFVKLSG